MRERGLKLYLLQGFKEVNKVAPRAGAWIETVWKEDGADNNTSLPVRERGLKQYALDNGYAIIRSLPVRERGLKHDM